jgi:hypothetical protein
MIIKLDKPVVYDVPFGDHCTVQVKLVVRERQKQPGSVYVKIMSISIVGAELYPSVRGSTSITRHVGSRKTKSKPIRRSTVGVRKVSPRVDPDTLRLRNIVRMLKEMNR